VPVVSGIESLNEQIEEFRKCSLIKESPKTLVAYAGDVTGFQSYLKINATDPARPLCRFTFVPYKQHLTEHYAFATINKKINSLKVYNDFLSV